MGFGGGQDEDDVRRRLLQRLEQGVGGLVGEHVDFVDDIDLVARLVGGIVDLLPQVADIVDAAVAGGINLDHIQGPALGDGLAHGAGIARLALAVGEAVDRLGQDARGAGLAGAARAAEEIGVRDAPLARALRRVRVTCSCPTTSARVWGRHLR